MDRCSKLISNVDESNDCLLSCGLSVYSNSADKMLPLLTNSGRIRHLTFQNAHITSKAGVFGSAVINTGTIDDSRISEIYSDCANKQMVYQRGGDLPPGVTDTNLVHDFPAHWYGFQSAGAVELVEDPHIENQPALRLKDQTDPFPISVGAYVPGKSGEILAGSCASVTSPNSIDNGKYQWVDCGEQMLFYSGRRIALCLGSTLPAYKQNGLTSTHEIEFSIPPHCRMPALPRGLYRLWAKIKTEQQPDGKYAISLCRVTLINQPLPIKGELSLSGEWTVFTSFDKNDPVPTSDDLSLIPEVLRIAAKEATAKKIDVRSGHVDFSPIWGGACEKRTGYVYIPFRIETAGEYTFGFGADWWYQAWIDGKPLSDTLDTGNGSQAGSLDHLATTRLDPGNHLMVVRFISGSGSSLLYVGGPSDIRPEK